MEGLLAGPLCGWPRARTFAGDMLTRLGLAHVFADSADPYPRQELASLLAAGPELLGAA